MSDTYSAEHEVLQELSPLGQAALGWAAKGFHVFPVRAELANGQKVPQIKGWRELATTDADQIAIWWGAWPDANIGCVPDKRGCYVADLDVKHGKDGVAELELLAACHRPFPETLTIRTASGGEHRWIRGRAPNSVDRIARGIDIRGARETPAGLKVGFVVLPPSSFGGQPYWLKHDAPIADCSWFTALAQRSSGGNVVQHPAATIEPDLPGNIARARDYLGRLVAEGDVAIQRQGGDNRTYALFCVMSDLGLSEDMALELVADIWNPSCAPSWEPDELAEKAQNAFAYADNPWGCEAWAGRTASEVFGPALTRLGLTGGGRPPAPLSWADVLARDPAPVRELIPGLVERGTVTFLAGPGGTHKSRLAIQWGLSVSTGSPVWGRMVERAAFVYQSYEDDGDEVARRVQAITRRLGLHGDSPGVYRDRYGVDAPLAVVGEDGACETLAEWHDLNAELLAIPGHKLLVIDSTYDAVRFVGQAKINEGAVMAGIALLQRLCNETDTTILALWHPSQTGQDRGDASGWSVAWVNKPRNRLSLDRLRDHGDAFELKVTKRNHGPRGDPITLHWDAGALMPAGDAAPEERDARLIAACVNAAIAAAEYDQPIQKQRRPAKWVFDEVETFAGFRPSHTQLKDVLALALRRGQLRYVGGTKDRMAGYYPPDPEHAAELARVAKGKTGEKPG